MTIVLPSRRLPIAEDAMVRKEVSRGRVKARAETVRRNREVRTKSICMGLIQVVCQSGVERRCEVGISCNLLVVADTCSISHH